ncbi:MAG: aldo/keto reductase [Candidatus Shapirobacteria bacterium]|jgi:diketogulonate reductase-like aldo/keto reductase
MQLTNPVPDIDLSSGHSIPVLGLGTYGLTGTSCIETIKTALEIGYRHFDTARKYQNEAEVGKAIRDFHRSDIFITSKVPEDQLDYHHVLSNADQSLIDLNTDYIDLYLIHAPNPEVDINETLQAFEKLVSDQKIHSIGVSNFGIIELQNTLSAARALNLPITNNQIEINPHHYPKDVINYCQKNNITITAYSPLDQGDVADDPVLTGIGRQYDKTAAQIALRYLVDKGLIVIPKASSRDHLQSNFDIFNFTLRSNDKQKISSL